jgi:hypothetical protein
MNIIQKRVALQQRQFKEFERREITRKSKKIKGVYDYLTGEEIEEMLEDCKNDEVKKINHRDKNLIIKIGRSDCSINSTWISFNY